MNRVMFIGGPGNISTSAVQEILGRNHEVAIFTLPESPDKGMKGKVKFYRGVSREQFGKIAYVEEMGLPLIWYKWALLKFVYP